MKLSYRGIDYGFNPSSLQSRGARQRLGEVSKARALGAILTYGGAGYTIEPSTQAASANSSVTAGNVLTYRGFSYRVQPKVQDVPVPAVTAQPAVANSAKAPVFSIQEHARVLTMNHHRALKKRQQVMLVRSAAEVGMVASY